MNAPEDFIGPVNLGNPRESTIRELAEMILQLTGSKSKLVFLPLPADDPRQRQPDISLARDKARLGAEGRGGGRIEGNDCLFPATAGRVTAK